MFALTLLLTPANMMLVDWASAQGQNHVRLRHASVLGQLNCLSSV